MNNVLVTGCTKGLGLSVCEKLIEDGYRVIGIGRTLSENYKRLIESNPECCFFHQYDFENISDIKNLVTVITKTYGRFYGLVNNAALGLEGVLATMHEKDIQKMITVNTVAPITLSKYLSRSMLLNRKGRIVNIGSIIGSTGFNGLSVYASTKASLEGFTKSLARELGKANITVNTVAPGYMETSMTQGINESNLERIVRRSALGRLASTEDAASAVSYLLSDAAKSITGTTITVDAGSTS